jgi:hypothetical protein
MLWSSYEARNLAVIVFLSSLIMFQSFNMLCSTYEARDLAVTVLLSSLIMFKSYNMEFL